jgi:cystathionine beta-lyase
VLAVWVAEMDFGLAPAVSGALHEAIHLGLTGYPSPILEQRTAESAVQFWSDRFGWSIEPDWVNSAPDVMTGLGRAAQHLTKPGAPVVVPSPVYYPFYATLKRFGREFIEVPSPVDESGRFTLDIAGIDAALASGAGSIALCNPWNPTGRVLSESELGDVVEVARRHDAVIISDEIHSPIVYEGNHHTPIASLDPDRVVTIAAASKAWNTPGLKCAQVVLTAEHHREVWGPVFPPEKVGVGTLGLIATAAAYSDGVEWFDDVLVQLHQARDLLATLVAERLPKARFSPPEGTYLAWVDMSAYGLNDPALDLLERARVAISGGRPFGGDSAQWIRINYATSPDVIEEVVERIARLVAT